MLNYYYETDGLLLVRSLKADTELCNRAVYPMSVLQDITHQINKYKPPILHDSLPYSSISGVVNSMIKLNQRDPLTGELDWEDKICGRAVNAFIYESYLYFYVALYKDYERNISTSMKRPSLTVAQANGDAMSTIRPFAEVDSGANPTGTKFGLADDFETKYKAGTHTLRWIGDVQVDVSNVITRYKLFGFKLDSKEHISEYKVINNIVCS